MGRCGPACARDTSAQTPVAPAASRFLAVRFAAVFLAAVFLAGAVVLAAVFCSVLAAAFFAGFSSAGAVVSPRDAFAFSTDFASAARRSTTSPVSSLDSGAWRTSPPSSFAVTSASTAWA